MGPFGYEEMRLGVVGRAKSIRDSLDRSQKVTDNMIAVLDSFHQSLTSLYAGVEPGQEEKMLRGRSCSSFSELTDHSQTQPSSAMLDELLAQTHAIRKAHQNIDNTIKQAEHILNQFDVCRKVEPCIIAGPKSDLDGYLDAVDKLQKNIIFFTERSDHRSNDGTLNRSQSLLSKAMIKLEEELRRILTQHSKITDPAQLRSLFPMSSKHANILAIFNRAGGMKDSVEMIDSKISHVRQPENIRPLNDSILGSSSVSSPTLVSSNAVIPLHKIVRTMVSAGQHQPCLKAYREVRASIMEHHLHKLGIEKSTKEDIQKLPWEVCEGKITNWTQCVKIFVQFLLAGERKICDQVFSQLEPHRNCGFADITGNNVSNFLSFGEAVVKSKKGPEKLFSFLNMYQTMKGLMPEVNLIFSGNECKGILREFSELLNKLVSSALESVREFEEAIEKDVSKALTHDGTVHPLTSYVVNYIKFLLEYKVTLENLFGEADNTKSGKLALTSLTTRITSALHDNLELKAKQYKDAALCHIFLMNNIHYMVHSIQSKSEAKEVLGLEWVQKQCQVVQLHATAYQHEAWNKALQYLNMEGLINSGRKGVFGGSAEGINNIVPRSILKERFKTFNTLVEDLHQRQIQWTIPDVELRNSVRLAVAEVLLPAYHSFLSCFSATMESAKNPKKYIKYKPEDLKQLLAEFFEGINTKK